MERRSTRHRMTRLGVQVMLIGVFGILGGSLNGLNLLVVVAAITLGGVMVQWRISRSMINSLRVDRRMPAEAFAGKPMRVRYQIHNEHRLMPIWLISLVDILEKMRRSDDDLLPPSKRPAKASPSGLQTLTGVGLLMPGQTTSAYFDLVAHHRGRYRFGRWTASTLAPLALSTAYRESIREQDYVDVYPRLYRLQRSWQRMLPSRIGNVSTTVHRQGPSNDVFFGLREYRHGDSPRHIHWRTTARLGEPAVRQFEQQKRFDLCLLIDAWSPHAETNTSDSLRQSSSSTLRDRIKSLAPKSAASKREAEDRASLGYAVDEHVERAISLAATVVVELTHGSENRVLLVVAGQEVGVVASGASLLGRKRMLQALARMNPSSQVPFADALVKASNAATRLPDLVVISSRSQTRAAAADAATALSLRRWKARSQVNWIDVSSKDVNQWVASESL
ncbi:DUF58 domain-containing protein [Aporhodopirellula aestuarii]|uniref:DUF58 domain-containing protein n=1 Tax=Aporhodopirellula aestuarii TaxID=2950107 RepID=A0ABT0U533_9BACT|nr:DUF58 domain-containing protein [Aporhodopirellula aestuarii]MCM2372031.1 DUF58 domain-containing protein [Aporhodopirellula aestuarii]